MRVAVLGATGRTGTLVTQSARAAGHDVTVLVRDPARLDDDTGLRVITGDATVRSDVDRVLDGEEAVISALGPTSLRRMDVVGRATGVYVASARAHRLHRLVHMSAFGVGATAAQASPLLRIAFRTVLRGYFRDKTDADETVERSGLDWTVVHPVSLVDGPPTGRLVATATLPPRAAKTVSRADVAEFMVECLTDPTWARRTVIVTN